VVSLVYRLIGAVLALVLLPWLLLHPKLRGRFIERLGFYGGRLARARGGVWFHAASAGDVRAIGPLVRRFAAATGGRVVVATQTTSGFAMAERELGGVAVIVRAPLDVLGAPGRAMRVARPRLVVLEYLELWPGLVFAAKRLHARVAVVNGRVGEKSLRFRALLRGVAGSVDLFLARGADDAANATRLGFRDVRIAGNTKHDLLDAATAAEIDAFCGRYGIARARAAGEPPVVVFGSTHDDEDAVFARLAAELSPMATVVWVPRYPSAAARIRRPAPAGTVAIDTVGDLRAAYGAAAVAVVGGTFGARGGQNPLEPVLAGCGVVHGGNLKNFSAEAAALGDAIVSAGATDVVDAVKSLLREPARRALLRDAAFARIASLRGATDCTFDALGRLIASPPENPAHILVVRLSALGDIVLTSPALLLLRQTYPQAVIDLLVDPPYAAIAAALPGVTHVVTSRAALAGPYALVIDFQNKLRSRIACALAARFGVPRVVLTKWEVSGLINRIRRRPITIDQRRIYADALSPWVNPTALPPLRLAVSDADRKTSASVLAANGFASSRLAIVFGTPSKPTKRYPHMASLIAALAAQGFAPVVVGATADETFGHPQALLGLPLGVVAALCERSSVVVGVDTGPVHIARAVGAPTVALFGPTSPTRWFPEGALTLALACSPCSDHGGARCPLGHHDCLEKLSVDAVVSRVKEIARA
jgi:3-deoxy-D-manno-octulosonic-acid transferase/ADP-heptose:LPS heptosyltransferase